MCVSFSIRCCNKQENCYSCHLSKSTCIVPNWDKNHIAEQKNIKIEKKATGLKGVENDATKYIFGR